VLGESHRTQSRGRCEGSGSSVGGSVFGKPRGPTIGSVCDMPIDVPSGSIFESVGGMPTGARSGIVGGTTSGSVGGTTTGGGNGKVGGNVGGSSDGAGGGDGDGGGSEGSAGRGCVVHIVHLRNSLPLRAYCRVRLRAALD